MIQSAVAAAARGYATEVEALRLADNTTEGTYYPAIQNLLNALLEVRGLPYRAQMNTSEGRASGGADKPDLVIYDAAGAGTLVNGEVKLPDVSIHQLAESTERNDQVGRYLAQTGVVLLCNIRSFGLLVVKPGYVREPSKPVPSRHRLLVTVVDLWESDRVAEAAHPIDAGRLHDLGSLLFQATTEHAPINRPDVLARILAEQARTAKAGLPARFDESVQQLLSDFKEALGLSFEDRAGKEFFRSSLIQTAYYALFAGWTLWHRANDGTEFSWERLDRYLTIPFLGQLFHEFRHPDRLADLRLAPHLDRAASVLGRVDRKSFFERFGVPSLDEAAPRDAAAAAITYFYEPFLEAFDPELRKALGVWYTPPEIVRYQVRRIDRLLRDDLGCDRGLADPQVVVLDPCCGTGAYLIEVVRCIAKQLREEGEQGSLSAEILDAICTRVIGFELLTASFVITQLQLYLILSELGTPPGKDRRPAVFLTNALSGWSGEEQVKLNFPELREERDAARRVKRDTRIIVILGNPPYNRWAGAAIEEERDLVDHYKGIKRDKKGRQEGPTLLYSRWGVRKHLLDDLYVRFFRLAEKQIGEKADFGIVSFISNSSFLTGRSHPLMRESLIAHFDRIWIDNLNGDKYRTGKVVPDGMPGEGTADQSIFTTPQDPRGIQVGTSITTYLKLRRPSRTRRVAAGYYRDLWGSAARKRQALLESLELDGLPPTRRRALAQQPEGPREYEEFTPSEGNRWKLAPRDENAGFEAWPAIDELFPHKFPGVHTGKDAAVLSNLADELVGRMRAYLDPSVSDDVITSQYPHLMSKANEFDDPFMFRRAMQTDPAALDESKVKTYLYRPLDARFIWYETTRRTFLQPTRWSGCLVQRYGEDYERAIGGPNEFLIAVPQPRRISETRPLLCVSLADLHVHDRGSMCFPRLKPAEQNAQKSLVERDEANLAVSAWRVLRDRWGIAGDIEGSTATQLVSDLFRVALALIHSPQYEADHQDSLAQDWAHVPIPRSRAVLDELVGAGEAIATLLDPARNADKVVREILGESGKSLGVLSRTDGRAVRDEDRVVRHAYFGGAPGKYAERSPHDAEPMLPAWGEATGDLFLNEAVFFQHVPEAVWSYELGGYPVLKKWLGYRQASRRDGRPLSVAEARHARSIVQRIAAMLVMHDRLDELYAQACADAWTAEELGLR